MKPAPTWADAVVSMVNAAVGDYLHGRGNGLHIPMAFYQHNRPLTLSAAGLAKACPTATAKVCVLVHGLGCTEGIWHFGKRGGCDPQLSYGSMLQADGGYTPLYVRYNTGLRLEANGQHLDSLLQGLLELYPLPIEELLLIGHSMGGLVIRHACGLGSHRGAPWTELVRRVFYLGSPHDGAPLAQFGTNIAGLLTMVAHPVTTLVRDVVDTRSHGIKDLHFGAGSVPWLPHAHHYLLAGTLTADRDHPITWLFGDTLVRLPSATGELTMAIDREGHVLLSAHVFPGLSHNALAHHATVYKYIRATSDE